MSTSTIAIACAGFAVAIPKLCGTTRQSKKYLRLVRLDDIEKLANAQHDVFDFMSRVGLQLRSIRAKPTLYKSRPGKTLSRSPIAASP